MGFTVSGLVDYVREETKPLLSAAILSAQTLREAGVTVQAGIKATDNLNFLAVTANMQVNGGCAYNASGTTTFTKKALSVTDLKVEQTFCVKDLEDKYTSKALVAGSNYESLAYEKEITDLINKTIGTNLDRTLWQGDTTNHVFDPNLKSFNGFIQVIDAGSPVIATATAAITTSNVIGIFQNVYSLIPAALLGQANLPTAFCGWDTFRLLVTALTNLNLFHYTSDSAAASGELMLMGTNMKIKALSGLNNITGTTGAYKDRIVCTIPENLVYGTDLANEYEQYKIWYSQDDDNIKLSVKWKSGCQVAFVGEVVTYKNT